MEMSCHLGGSCQLEIYLVIRRFSCHMEMSFVDFGGSCNLEMSCHLEMFCQLEVSCHLEVALWCGNVVELLGTSCIRQPGPKLERGIFSRVKWW